MSRSILTLHKAFSFAFPDEDVMFVCRQPAFTLIRLDISSRPRQEMYLHLIPPLTFLLLSISFSIFLILFNIFIFYFFYFYFFGLGVLVLLLQST